MARKFTQVAPARRLERAGVPTKDADIILKALEPRPRKTHVKLFDFEARSNVYDALRLVCAFLACDRKKQIVEFFFENSPVFLRYTHPRSPWSRVKRRLAAHHFHIAAQRNGKMNKKGAPTTRGRALVHAYRAPAHKAPKTCYR